MFEYRSSGAQYADGTQGKYKTDDHVPPGGSHVYAWQLTSDFAPRDDDPSCLPWAYHSHTNSEKEINSGLIGLLVVCKPGSCGVCFVILS